MDEYCPTYSCGPRKENMTIPEGCSAERRGFICTSNDSERKGELKEYCESWEGVWTPTCCFCPGLDMWDSWTCNLPYSDGGEECSDSDDCVGDCRFSEEEGKLLFAGLDDVYEIECLDCVGTCQEYPENCPSGDYTLDDGKLYYSVIYY
jgi:hypothetical protein